MARAALQFARGHAWGGRVAPSSRTTRYRFAFLSSPSCAVDSRFKHNLASALGHSVCVQFLVVHLLKFITDVSAGRRTPRSCPLGDPPTTSKAFTGALLGRHRAVQQRIMSTSSIVAPSLAGLPKPQAALWVTTASEMSFAARAFGAQRAKPQLLAEQHNRKGRRLAKAPVKVFRCGHANPSWHTDSSKK